MRTDKPYPTLHTSHDALRMTDYASVEWVLVGGMTLFALGLRLWQGGRQPLWLDEAFSLWMARHPPGDLLVWLVRIDQHPPLYYLLLHAWISLFGDGEAAIRSLSAILSALTIPAIFLLGRQLGGRRLGQIAALLLAVSPLHIRYGQEARMYTLQVLTTTLSLYFMARILDLDQRRAPEAEAVGLKERSPSDWTVVMGLCLALAPEGLCLFSPMALASGIGYMIFTAAALWTHNTMILLPLGQTAVILMLVGLRHRGRILGRWQPPPLRTWLIAQAGILLLWSPWLPAFIVQSRGVDERFWVPFPTLNDVYDTLHDFSSYFAFSQATMSTIIACFYGGLLLLGVIHWRRQPGKLLFLLGMFLAPIAGELLVSLHRPIYLTRTILWASIPYLLLVAGGVLHLPRLKAKSFAGQSLLPGLALAALLTLNLTSTASYYRDYQKEPWDQAAAYVAANAQPGDVILFDAGWTRIPFEYYYGRYHQSQTLAGLPADPFDSGQLEPLFTTADLPRLDRLIQNRPQVWVVYSHTLYTDPNELVNHHLSLTLKSDTLRTWPDIRIVRYMGTHDAHR